MLERAGAEGNQLKKLWQKAMIRWKKVPKMNNETTWLKNWSKWRLGTKNAQKKN